MERKGVARKITMVAAASVVAVAFVLAGCGSNSCSDACYKVAGCVVELGIPVADANVAVCTNKCEAEPASRGCALDCNTNDSCAEYFGCIVNCGVTWTEE